MTDVPQLVSAQPRPRRSPGAMLHCDSDFVGVRVERHHRRLVALRPVTAGTRMFAITGRETTAPTRYSLQVGPALHLDQDCARDELDLVWRYFWRYLDHHCDPTTVIRDREVIAVRDIAEGDGVTFNYNTTEYDMAAPFRCHCGSDRCAGVIRGARHLPPAERARLAPWLSDWLLESAPVRPRPGRRGPRGRGAFSNGA